MGNNKTKLTSTVIDNPPEPFSSFRYRCDSTFEISQLEEMLIDRTSYGLFVIDRSEAAYGLASGKRLHFQEHITSLVPQNMGEGVSLPRDSSALSRKPLIISSRKPQREHAITGFHGK